MEGGARTSLRRLSYDGYAVLPRRVAAIVIVVIARLNTITEVGRDQKYAGIARRG